MKMTMDLSPKCRRAAIGLCFCAFCLGAAESWYGGVEPPPDYAISELQRGLPGPTGSLSEPRAVMTNQITADAHFVVWSDGARRATTFGPTGSTATTNGSHGATWQTGT